MGKGKAAVVLCTASLTACALGVDWDRFADAPATVVIARDAALDAATPAPIVATAAEAGISTYPDAILASRPIAYYEDDGVPLVSEVPGAPAGALVPDARHVPGRVGRGLQLDGSGQDRIVFGDSFAFILDATRAFSLEILVEVERVNTDYARIFSREPGPGSLGGLAVYSTQSALGFVRADAAGYPTMHTDHAPLGTGTFVHVVAACDSRQCRLVVDGVSQKGAVPAGAGAPPASVPFVVGARSTNANNVKGIFDELAIYDHALSDEEIAAHLAALP